MSACADHLSSPAHAATHNCASEQAVNAGLHLGSVVLPDAQPEPAAGALASPATPARLGSVEIAQYAARRVVEGAKWREIAAELGLKTDNVRVLCNRHGVLIRRGPLWPRERVLRAAKVAAIEGVPRAAKAERCTPKALEKALQRHGISVTRIRAHLRAAR
jgi:hypothetical protein